MIKRRFFLGGAAASLLPSPLWAEAPLTSPRPLPRGGKPVQPGAEMALWTKAKLSGGFAALAVDRASGRVLSSLNPDLPLPPASVTKAVTALYALEALGPDFRFATRLMRVGEVVNGRLEGDLYLVGGGDPNLDSDDLGDLAAALAATGLKSVSGRFVICDGALPHIAQITKAQPAHLGYNPTISGVVLNYNRVNFEWLRDGQGGWRLGMDARGERFLPQVKGIQGTIADRELPLFTHKMDEASENWTVARSGLTGDGSRWLPVRRPAPYVAEVFATLARAHGLDLAPAVIERLPPPETVQIVAHQGDPLTEVIRGMLRHSTNLTAEVLGLTASGAGSLPGSGAAMTDWARRKLGLTGSRFADHSGLGPESLTTAQDLIRVFQNAGRLRHGGLLDSLTREMGLADADGREQKTAATRIRAKSGTMNFVSNLAGVIDRPERGDILFAILCADAPRRDAVPLDDREEPDGAKGWTRRARRLHQQVIRDWSQLS